jgi:hypothetical protein
MVIAENHPCTCQTAFLRRFEDTIKRRKKSIIVGAAKEDQWCDQDGSVKDSRLIALYEALEALVVSGVC